MRRAWRDWRDLPGMQDLLARDLRDGPSTAFLHPGDLAWWLGWPPKTSVDLAAIATLWEEDGKVAAWVVLDDDDVGECVDAEAPGAEDLRFDIDRWLGSRPRATRYVREDDGAGVDRLLGAGYSRFDDESMLGFSLDLTAIELRESDPRVRAVADGDDLGPRASVTRAAFHVEGPLERYVSRYAAFMASPVYPAGWDLVAWASPDVAAACAIVWPDPTSRVGNFEPVAAHPDFHRQGYATAVLREGCRRLRDAGMTRAIARTPADNRAAIALYRSVGFSDDHEQAAFRRV